MLRRNREWKESGARRTARAAKIVASVDPTDTIRRCPPYAITSAEGRRGAGYQYPFGDPARLFHLSAFPRARIGDASRRDEIRAIDSRESRSRTLTRLHRGLARKFAKMSGMYLRNTIYAEIRYRGEDKDAMNSNEDWEYAREIQGAIRDRRQ